MKYRHRTLTPAEESRLADAFAATAIAIHLGFRLKNVNHCTFGVLINKISGAERRYPEMRRRRMGGAKRRRPRSEARTKKALRLQP